MSINTEQFTMLWTEAMPKVSAYVNSMVPDMHEAQDVLQEVSLALFRKIDKYDQAKPFTAWAMGMARYEILNSRRRFARHPMIYSETITDLVAETCVEMSDELELRKKVLKKCVSKLALKGWTQEAFSLYYQSEMKPRHIAERLGMGSSRIRTMLSRVRDSLRKCLVREIPEARTGI